MKEVRPIFSTSIKKLPQREFHFKKRSVYLFFVPPAVAAIDVLDVFDALEVGEELAMLLKLESPLLDEIKELAATDESLLL